MKAAEHSEVLPASEAVAVKVEVESLSTVAVSPGVAKAPAEPWASTVPEQSPDW